MTSAFKQHSIPWKRLSHCRIYSRSKHETRAGITQADLQPQDVRGASPAAGRVTRTAELPCMMEHVELGLWPALPYRHLHSTFLTSFALNKQQKSRKIMFLVSGKVIIFLI